VHVEVVGGLLAAKVLLAEEVERDGEAEEDEDPAEG